MVYSTINPQIDYNENTDLDEKDKNFDADVWNYSIYDQDEMIAVGSKNIKDGVEYFPIYLVKHDLVVAKIGVFEMKDSNAFLDNEGDLDVNKLDPLYFSFVNPVYLKNMELSAQKEDMPEELEVEETAEDVKEPEESTSLPLLQDGVFKIDPNYKEEFLPNQTRELGEEESQTIEDSSKNKWVARYLSNPYFEIKETKEDGNCLLEVIVRAMASVGRIITIKRIREILAKEATEEIFQMYKVIYEENTKEQQTLKDLAKKKKALHDEKKDKFGQANIRSEQVALKNDADIIRNDYNSLIKAKTIAGGFGDEFKFMENVNTLEEFRQKIQTCEFWADTWAISLLERILNIKIIIFDFQAYEQKDLDNVILCGSLDDRVLEEKGVFEPDYYILANYLGRHYECILFKDKSAFKFNEIFWEIRYKIASQCLEGISGIYKIIPEFEDFKKKLDLQEPEKPPSTSDSIDLYDGSVEFMLFFEAKNSKKGLGKLNGEIIPDDKRSQFSELAAIENWRKILSNMYHQEFTLDNKAWWSVEHYIQANKFKSNTQIYDQFSLDSQTELSKNPEMARSFGNDTIYNKQRYRPKELNVDADYNERESYISAYNAKISQDPLFGKTLKLTKQAKLMLRIKRRLPREQIELMTVRKTLA